MPRIYIIVAGRKLYINYDFYNYCVNGELDPSKNLYVFTDSYENAAVVIGKKEGNKFMKTFLPKEENYFFE